MQRYPSGPWLYPAVFLCCWVFAVQSGICGAGEEPASSDDQTPSPKIQAESQPTPPPGNPVIPGTLALKSSSALPYVPLTRKEKWNYYLQSTYGPVSLMRSSAVAGINQWRNKDPEWGQGMEGYGKRLASKLGNHIIKRSIHHSLGVLWNEDPRYLPSAKVGIFPRGLYAASRSFIVRRDDGRDKIADARLIGVFAGSFISRRWQPENDRGTRNALESAGISIAIDAGLNVVREFWPEIRRTLLRR
jgi:hypothetical protein